jgi:Flp pilus assembly protein TadG
MKHARTSKRRTRGMAMVEMVFVLPLLILLVFAIAQFGLMFSRWLTLSNAVREGARVGVVFRGTVAECNAQAPPVETQVRNAVKSYAQAGGIPLQDAAVNVNGQCAGSGTQLTVDASYPFTLDIPFAHLDPVTLRYSSAMRNE